jgi:hypothetical protein
MGSINWQLSPKPKRRKTDTLGKAKALKGSGFHGLGIGIRKHTKGRAFLLRKGNLKYL